MSLFCTLGKYAIHETQYPQDGLCDVFFYTHVVFVPNAPDPLPGIVFEPHTPERGYMYFIAKAQSWTGNNTQFGVSLDARFTASTQVVMDSDKGCAAVDRLWKWKIRNYGVLNVNGVSSEFSDYDHLKKTFSKLDSCLQVRKAKEPKDPEHVLVLAVKLENYSPIDQRISYANKLRIWAMYKITHLVINTALNTWREEWYCQAFPPTIWLDAINSVHPSLEKAIPIAKAADFNEALSVLFAFTMVVKVFAPYDKSDTAISSQCSGKSVLNALTLCQGGLKVINYQSAMTSGAMVDRFLLLWDSAENVEAKMKLVFEQYPRRRSGFLLFDVDYLYPAYTCPPLFDSNNHSLHRARRAIDAHLKELL